MRPAEAYDILKEGNKRFVDHKSVFGEGMEMSSSSMEKPMGVLLTCIHNCMPSENIFDQKLGSLSNVDVDGNFVTANSLSAVENSCNADGAKVIVVLGNSNCEAIKCACDGEKACCDKNCISALQPAIDSVRVDYGNSDSSDYKFVQKVAAANVLKSMRDLRVQSKVVNDLIESGEVLLTGALYDNATGQVNFL